MEEKLLNEEELATTYLFENKGHFAKDSRMSLRTTPRFSWALELLKREINFQGSSNQLIETLVWDFIKRSSLESIRGSFESISPMLPRPNTSLLFLSGINPFTKKYDYRIQSVVDMTWSYFKIFRLIKLSIARPALLRNEEKKLLSYICSENFFWNKMPEIKHDENGELLSINFKNSSIRPIPVLVGFGEWDVNDIYNSKGSKNQDIKKGAQRKNMRKDKLVEEILDNFFTQQGSNRTILSEAFKKIQINLEKLKNEKYSQYSKEIENTRKHDFNKFLKKFRSNRKTNVSELEDLKFINYEIEMLLKLIDKQIL